MPNIEYFDAYAGAGKTYAIARQADKMARRGEKVMIVQPSRLLIDKTLEQELLPLRPDYSITAIHSNTVPDGAVTRTIVDHCKAAKDGVGEILLITHRGFELCPYWFLPERWTVIVDEVFNIAPCDELKIPDTHPLITAHLQHVQHDAKYSRISVLPNACDGSDRTDHTSALKKVGTNENRDKLYEVVQDFVRFVLDDRYHVYVISDQYLKMIQGKEKDSCKLAYFAEMNVSVFNNFKRAIVCSALFKGSLMYQLWAEAGVTWKPVSDEWRRTLRYLAHPNGKQISFYYASIESWSKTYRDRLVMDGDPSTVFDVFQTAIKDLVGNSPTIWMGNKDTDDAIWAPKVYQDGTVEQVAKFERLPNSPHGLNDYQSYNNCVITSALNATPAHFAWLASRGLDGEAVRTAMSRSATYQALMRSSMRDPKSGAHKRGVVMDRETAVWLAEEIFPGAKALPLPGVGLAPLQKGTPGRPKKYVDVDRRIGYRQAMRDQLLADLMSISGDELVEVNRFSVTEIPNNIGVFDTRNRSEIAPADRFHGSETPNNIGVFEPRNRSPIRLPLFENKYSQLPFHHVEISNHDDLIGALAELSRDLVHVNKEDSALISAAHFSPNPWADTERGLDNIEYIYGIWFDCDGGDLSPEKFAGLFPYLRMCMYSTFTSTPEKPKWRCLIPTTHSMTIRIHEMLIQQMLQVVNEAGYWGADQLAKNDKIKSRLDHGFDRSKFTPSSMFYLPSRPRVGEPMFVDFNDASRGPLNVPRWIEKNILDLKPEPVYVAPIDTSLDHMSPDKKALTLALRNRESLTVQGVNRTMVAKALDEWRGSRSGEGNQQFFVLGARLQDAGMALDEIEHALRQEHSNSGSASSDRKAQIKSIIRTLSRRGSTRRMHGNSR